MIIATLATLVVVVGGLVVMQVTGQMRGDDDNRLDAHAAAVAIAAHDTIRTASSDIRLARRNIVFDQALQNTPGQLLPADRAAVEAAITYLGDRYQVDEICLIRASGLEAARWVGGSGVAPVGDLSVDERQNNPAVVPTMPLADDAFHETAPYVSPDSGRWVLGVATPIVLADGEHAGILHFEIPIAHFEAQFAALGFGDSGYDVLLDRDGHMLVGPQLSELRAAAGTSTDPATAPFPLASGAGSVSWKAAVAQMIGGQSGTVAFDANGRSYRASFHPVLDSNRIVATISPTTELYADVDRALLNLAATAGPLLVLILFAIFWFTRRMARANRGLSGLNERLTSTNGRLEAASRVSADLAHESAIVNQFTELTALTEDDVSLSEATLATLDELVHLDHAVLHVSNQSQDRAVPQATLGDRAADVLSLHDLGRCPAVRRSSLYVTDDVGSRLAFHCPIYPVEQGTLVCVPLVALGETIGAIHLYWAEPRELSLPLRLAITRVSEHSALSIANRRLLLALHGQATTDGRTGLTNSRAFDEIVERRLASQPNGGSSSVLMLDLDHFKDFNDRYGHPAGDEALRAFAQILASCTREGDVAARYGGEEFAVYLGGLDEAAAVVVAERIRERTEASIISLGPGLTGRVTVSIGVASAPADGTERVVLLKAADEALYRAKLAGRNRVMTRSTPDPLAGPLRVAAHLEHAKPGRKLAAEA